MSELSNKFIEIYKKNSWHSEESASGLGSELISTKKLREELPFLFKKYNVTSILDIPCGDFNWMKELDLTNIQYLGADIVPELIEKNKKLYPKLKFEIMDVTLDDLPKVDLIFVRDCFGHLSDEKVLNAIQKIKLSGSKYLLSTSFTKINKNDNIEDGGWRAINLMIEPFKLKPQYLINENCTEAPHFNDKCMLLFDLNNLYSI